MILLPKFCDLKNFRSVSSYEWIFKNDNEDAAPMRFEAAMGSCR